MKRVVLWVCTLLMTLLASVCVAGTYSPYFATEPPQEVLEVQRIIDVACEACRKAENAGLLSRGRLRRAAARTVAEQSELLRRTAEELAAQFAQAVKEDINPRDSWRAAKDFRMHIAVESARRAFIEAVKLAGGDL